MLIVVESIEKYIEILARRPNLKCRSVWTETRPAAPRTEARVTDTTTMKPYRIVIDVKSQTWGEAMDATDELYEAGYHVLVATPQQAHDPESGQIDVRQKFTPTSALRSGASMPSTWQRPAGRVRPSARLRSGMISSGSSIHSTASLMAAGRLMTITCRSMTAPATAALGFWKAIEEVFPSTRHQRCWVHKTANVLNKVALSVQVNMKADLREIYGAPTRAAAEAAIDVFADKYGDKYDKAVACLTKDREALLAFFDFPAEHWDHLRTSNPIESVFATVRHRTVRTKGALSAKTAKLMVFKLVNAAAKNMAAIKGRKPVAKGRPRYQIPKRHRGHRNAGPPRRLIGLVT